MTGRLWMFSHLLDTDDLEFGSHEFITYKMGIKYYGMGEKKCTNAAWKSGAVYKCGKLVLIRRSIFEKYLRNEYMRNCCFGNRTYVNARPWDQNDDLFAFTGSTLEDDDECYEEKRK